MKLYNCYSKKERELKEVELETLSSKELIELANNVRHDFKDAVLEDENIVVDALHEIVGELGQRLLT